MTNPQEASRRIIGVRTLSAGPMLFCEAGLFSPDLGDWVIVEQDDKTFPAQVALPDTLVEADQLTNPLPKLVRPATESDLAAAGNASALAAQAARLFAEVSAAHNMPYLLKEVRVWPDRLIIRFSAIQSPTDENYVTLLEALAAIFPARIELFVVSEAAAGLIGSTGDNLVNWVNGLLVELNPAIMANATVGQSLLDESAVYRPGQRPSGPPPAQPEPAAFYDPATKTLSVGGQPYHPPA